MTRLDQRFTLLTTGALDLPAHQQTLRRAIDWSYALLDAAERTLFRRLAVFVGGWTLGAAAAVLSSKVKGQSSEPTTAELLTLNSELLTLLPALVDQSLVQREEGSDGQSRFTMLETIREYARECLAQAGELEATQQQHLVY